jgi:hypothetical protein
VAPSCSNYARPSDSPSRTLWLTVQRVRVTVCSVRETLTIHLPTCGTSEAATEEARAEDAKSEDINLENMVADIDKMLLNMAAEEAAAATEEITAAKPEKEEMTEDTSEDEAFDFQNLVGQELTKVKKEELKEYAISCGYRPGALLFGGIDDERLGCIRDQTGAKVIGTLSKSIGFPKLEADISRYRRQHIVGSLFYSNFKVNNFCLTFIICNNINVF